jgi:hypothetical protein
MTRRLIITGAASGTPLPVTAVQPLGAPAEFDTGVIHVGRRDPLGPQIVLDVRPPGSATPAGQVTPVLQISSDPPTRRGSRGGTSAYPEVQQVARACPRGSEGFRRALLCCQCGVQQPAGGSTR